MRIAFATTQLPLLTEAGGISNPTLNLALGLKQSGHEVSIVICRTQYRLTHRIKQQYQNMGLDVIEVMEDRGSISPWWLAFQYGISEEMLKLKPDVVIAQEWQAPLALLSGSLDRPIIISWTHGGTYFEVTGSNREFYDKSEVMLAGNEYIQLKGSDAIVAPSNFIKAFYDYTYPKLDKWHVVPLLFPEFSYESQDKEVKEHFSIAFVGSLSTRKGFDLFVNLAVEISKKIANVEVLIFGRESDLDLKALEKVLVENKVTYKVDQTKNSQEIWNVLSTKNTTLVVPSRLDNSPGVIYEALSCGVKVLASGTQGGLELAKYAEKSVAPLDELKIDEVVKFVMENPFPEVEVALENQGIVNSWNDLIENLVEERNKANIFVETQYEPTVSVIIASRNRSEFLKHALNSVLSQSLQPNEVIVVDDFSDSEDDYANVVIMFKGKLNILLLRNNKCLGQSASRDLGVSRARGKYVAFLDDDNLFLADHLESCICALTKHKLDAITPYLAQSYSRNPLTISSQVDQIAVFAGALFGEVNLLENVCCDSHIVIEKSVFSKAGGFRGFGKVAQEDWALGLRIISAGYKFGSIHKPTILYRLNDDGVQASSSTSAKWLPINASSNFLHTESWVIPQIARLAKDSNAARQTSLNMKYIKRGLNLLKRGDLVGIYYGVQKKFGK